MEDPRLVLGRLRASFNSGVTLSESFRQDQLMKMKTMIRENEEQILEALHQDMKKPKFEAVMAELDLLTNDLTFTMTNLSTWMQPESASTNLATMMDQCFVRREPLGLVLIIGPWNYPLQLLLLPMVGAIAAGNSEVSAATDRIISELLPKYLSQECYAVIRGGPEETQELLNNRFDHIFYTGSQVGARLVLQAAALHFTPVTLELGGKCPCAVYGRVNVTAAARRLVWAKFFNAGQSCVAPDYVLCSSHTRELLLPELRAALLEFYGPDPRASPDLCRIVSPRHWTRLHGLLEKTRGRVVIGGDSDQEEKYMAPTVVVDVREDDALMGEEVFGPILPILTVETVEEAVQLVQRGQKPLALYAFSEDSSVVQTFLEKTSSGGFCSNDGIVHMTLPSLPFGGVGASGWGNYHGRWGFETFSHRRAVLLRGWSMERFNTLRYPPYSHSKLDWLRWTTSPHSCVMM